MPGVREAIRPNRLFIRLAGALEMSVEVTELLVAHLLVRVDATPGTMTPEQLRALRPSLIAVVDTIFPRLHHTAARIRLEELLAE